MHQSPLPPLRLLISEPNFPHVHMERDAELLRAFSASVSTSVSVSASEQTPLLHYYDWSVPSLTYGYFACPHTLLHLDQLKRYGWHAARRPTGGGVIFHLTDFAFSLLIPRSHPYVCGSPHANYAWINALVLQAIQPFLGGGAHLAHMDVDREACQEEDVLIGNRRPTFCMAQISCYDLVVDGKKVGGAAQRKTREGLLHQGSLYLADPPFEIIQEVVREGQQMVQTMRETSRPLMTQALSAEALCMLRCELRHALYESLSRAFAVSV